MAVTDNFNRADGALGANWAVPTGQTGFVISGNEARGSGASNCISYYSAFTPTADQYVQFKAANGPFGPDGQAGFGTGGAVRVSTTARTCYALFINVAAVGEVQVAKLVAGAKTIIGTYSAGATPVVGDVFKMTVVGSAIEVFKNGVSVLTIPSDTSISSGRLGMANEIWNFTSAVDDWEGDSIGASGVTLVVPLLSSTAVLYAPAVGISAHIIAPPLITSGATLFAPAITSGGITLVVPLLGSTAVLYAPAVGVSAHIVAPPLITSGVVLYAPTITYGGSAVAPPLLASGVVLYAPTIVPGASSLALPMLGSSAVLYAPAVGISGIIIAPPLVTSGVVLYAPTIEVGVPVGTLAVPFLSSTALFFAPAIAPGAGSITLPFLAPTAILFEPWVRGDDEWSPCVELAQSLDWAPCRPGSDLLLATLVESPRGGWMVTTDPAAVPVASLAESERGGFTVDPSGAALGGALLESVFAVGILDPDRSVPIADDYHPLIAAEWADC